MGNLRSLVVVVVGLVVLWLLSPGSHAPRAGDAHPPVANSSSGVIVVDYLDDTAPEVITALEHELGVVLDWASAVSEDEALRSGRVDNPAAIIERLKGHPLVEVAEVAVTMQAFAFPDDPLYEQQWNLRLVDIPIAWRVGAGAGVTVAVIDTGVTAHKDLPPSRVLPGRSFVPGVSEPADDHGHGTHVAGTIAQETDNGFGVAGLAWRSQILPLKVLDQSGSGRSDWIAAAIDEAVDQGAQVINLSLGGGHSAVVVNAVEKARRAGVVVVAAAGNAGREGLGSPADALSAIAVSAVGPDDKLAPYSSWGKGVEIAAPGGDTSHAGGGILQGIAGPGGESRFVAWQGTSMATPHVAGAAAVLLGAGAGSATSVERMLAGSADQRDDALRFGAGRLDLGAAVRRLLTRRFAWQALIAALLVFVLGAMGGLGGGRRLLGMVTAAVVAGGLWFLPLLGLGQGWLLSLLARPLLAWPGVGWSGFPLWLSLLLPLMVAVVLAPNRRLGWLAVGLAVGLGTGLLHGALTGSLQLWWLGEVFGRLWLLVNGLACLLLALAVSGVQSHADKGGLP